jgi:hypothetical protein
MGEEGSKEEAEIWGVTVVKLLAGALTAVRVVAPA